jgi:hypothetical protein
MIDRDELAGSNGRRNMWIRISYLGIVAAAGFIVGYLNGQEPQDGGTIGTAEILTLCVCAAIIIGLVAAQSVQ